MIPLDETTKLSQNLGHITPSNVAPHPPKNEDLTCTAMKA